MYTSSGRLGGRVELHADGGNVVAVVSLIPGAGSVTDVRSCMRDLMNFDRSLLKCVRKTEVKKEEGKNV